MKSLFSILAIAFSLSVFAQQNVTFQVSGNCGMCKSRIEKAAKEAGASDAKWNKETQQLAVSFASNTTLASIQQKVAAVGHDNAGAKASDDVYNKLHGCCKYDRTAAPKSTEKESCCSEGESCKHDDSKAAGSCCDKPCCKDGKCAKCGDCCKDGKCTKGGDCCKEDKKMSCCKDGKCSMPNHDGKDCCKKS